MGLMRKVNSKKHHEFLFFSSSIFLFFFGEPILSTEKNEVAFSTTKSIIIFNYAEQIPKKSENKKFKVQEIEIESSRL